MRVLQKYSYLIFFDSIQSAEMHNIKRTSYILYHIFLRRVRIQSMFNFKFYLRCLEEALRSDVGFTDEEGIKLVINKLNRKKNAKKI